MTRPVLVFTFSHSFHSPQMRRNKVVITKRKKVKKMRGFLHDLRLRKLGNSTKSLKCLEFNMSTQPQSFIKYFETGSQNQVK